ncbi:MAG: methyltransferase [Cyclobacteriaceae bacterium]|nr:methyltransferase [Cyclobacteriaceae bacterium]
MQNLTEKQLTALNPKFEAQKIAFSPIVFQTVISLRELGILDYLFDNFSEATIEDICDHLKLSDYGVRVLLEMAECADIIEYINKDRVKLTKVGFFILNDELTRVNLNFVNDVCYHGAKSLTECIKTGKPEGLKVLGNWKTVYEGLSQLPEKIKTSWFEFDHYYSDDAFPTALKIVFNENPKYIFDIGGNTGKWSFACCDFDKNVNVKILDLPGQLNIARENAKNRGLLNRVDFHQIDLLDEFQKIPKGADAIWMSQFLDCFSPEEIIKILKNVKQAASDTTNIYIMEPFFDNQRFPAAKYSLTATSLYFTTIANGNSKMYSCNKMKELVSKSGLEVVEVFPLIGDSYHTILKCRKTQ